MPASTEQSAIVVGAGPAGLTTAISLAAGGVSTVLVGVPATRNDTRTTALLAGSVTALDTLGVWDQCSGAAAPLKFMRIIDDTGRLWRAPEVKFAATEIGLDAFGYNIENHQLLDALERKLGELHSLRRIASNVTHIAPHRDAVTMTLSNGETLTTALAIGADGRNSPCRKAAGIPIDEHTYPQIALTLCFRHTRSHGNISTEFHTAHGPFTIVPLPGDRSSLVWVLDPGSAEEFSNFDDAALAVRIEQASHSILGKVSVEGERGLFPLRVARSRRFADRRVALVGEAAHVIPPIGAQGLNLGLRDAATIAELVVTAHRNGTDIGNDDTLSRYDHMRRADVGTRTLAIDILNRSLLSDFLPLQSARGLGLYMLGRVGPLRRAVMREGIGPAAAQPRLMRGEAL
jgi:2-octaprenyl-6-methoxyphenol hydroxylase